MSVGTPGKLPTDARAPSECGCVYNCWPGTKHVSGKGPIHQPRIAIIGEAPGAEEDQTGEPFAGGSGRILNAWLAKTGINRSECYVDNILSHRPPDNDVDQANLPEAYRLFNQRIARVKPNIILALGNTALRAFIPGANIGDWRGSVFTARLGDAVLKVMPTFHPAFIMRQKRMWDVVLHDLRRLSSCSHLPQYTEMPHHVYHIDPSPVQLEGLLDHVVRADKPTAVDIETDWGWAAIDRIGVCNEPGIAITAPLNADTMRVWANFFLNIKTTVMHNGLFDAFHLRKVFPWVKPCTHDTMLYHHLLYQHLPHDLGFLCSIYTMYPYYKNQIHYNMPWYNCRDVDTTLRCYIALMQELKELNLV